MSIKKVTEFLHLHIKYFFGYTLKHPAKITVLVVVISGGHLQEMVAYEHQTKWAALTRRGPHTSIFGREFTAMEFLSYKYA